MAAITFQTSPIKKFVKICAGGEPLRNGTVLLVDLEAPLADHDPIVLKTVKAYAGVSPLEGKSRKEIATALTGVEVPL